MGPQKKIHFRPERTAGFVNPMKKAIVIGASSGIGKALSYKLAANDYQLILCARSERDLQAIQSDLILRFGTKAALLTINLDQTIPAATIVNKSQALLGTVTEVYITAGKSISNDYGIVATNLINQIINVNYASIINIINEFAKYLLTQKQGSITVISSIAASAPRSQNLVYASAKKGLETYCLGLRHFLADKNINVNIIALGYADTSLAYGKKLLFPVVSPAKVADYLFSLRTKNTGLTFFPFYWRYILWILALVPWIIYKKLKF